MNIAEFKSANGIEQLDFRPSKHSKRHVAVDETKQFMLVTTADFDPRGEAHVYKATASEQVDLSGDLELYWVTNKAQSAPAFSL